MIFTRCQQNKQLTFFNIKVRYEKVPNDSRLSIDKSCLDKNSLMEKVTKIPPLRTQSPLLHRDVSTSLQNHGKITSRKTNKQQHEAYIQELNKCLSALSQWLSARDI